MANNKSLHGPIIDALREHGPMTTADFAALNIGGKSAIRIRLVSMLESGAVVIESDRPTGAKNRITRVWAIGPTPDAKCAPKPRKKNEESEIPWGDRPINKVLVQFGAWEITDADPHRDPLVAALFGAPKAIQGVRHAQI